MFTLIKRAPGVVHLRDAAREIVDAAREITAAAKGKSAGSKRLVSTYLAANAVRKLHLGCGENILPGWLNSDSRPEHPEVVFLDASKRFPFEGDTFDYVFSEHMIEHLRYADGLAMLSECYRVLNRDGRIRVSTPDLKFLIGLYSDNRSELQNNYIKWSFEYWIKSGECTDTAVINNFVRHWGHLFIYDEKTLRRSLSLCGFVDITAHAINASGDPHLRELENEGRMPAGFLQLETFTLEARKP